MALGVLAVQCRCWDIGHVDDAYPDGNEEIWISDKMRKLNQAIAKERINLLSPFYFSLALFLLGWAYMLIDNMSAYAAFSASGLVGLYNTFKPQ
jgi:hypothetical protein